MKKILLITTILAFGATVSYAGTTNFENNELYVKGIHKNLEFSLSGNQVDGVTSAEARGLVLTYAISPKVNSGIEVFAAYTNAAGSDFYTLGSSYNVAYTVNPTVTLYGEAELAYSATGNDLNGGEVSITPKVGVTSKFNDRVTGFAEVKYGWLVTDSWSETGGRAEMGLDIAVNDTVMVVPSVVGYFDSNNLNEVQGRLGVEFKF